VSATVLRMSSRARVGSMRQPPVRTPRAATNAVHTAWSRYCVHGLFGWKMVYASRQVINRSDSGQDELEPDF
jgi:hypothetical protein